MCNANLEGKKVVTTMLRQPPCLVASPRDDEGNCSRRVDDSRQGYAVVAGHGAVGRLSPTCAAANGSHPTPGFGIFRDLEGRRMGIAANSSVLN